MKTGNAPTEVDTINALNQTSPILEHRPCFSTDLDYNAAALECSVHFLERKP
jgi:hypothetical protein